MRTCVFVPPFERAGSTSHQLVSQLPASVACGATPTPSPRPDTGRASFVACGAATAHQNADGRRCVHKKTKEKPTLRGSPRPGRTSRRAPSSSGPLDDRPLFQARRPPLHRFLFRTAFHLRDCSISIGRRIERSITSDAGRAELRFPEQRHIRPDGIVLRQADPQTKLQSLIEASPRRFGHVVVRRVELRRGLVQPLAEGP